MVTSETGKMVQPKTLRIAFLRERQGIGKPQKGEEMTEGRKAGERHGRKCLVSNARGQLGTQEMAEASWAPRRRLIEEIIGSSVLGTLAGPAKKRNWEVATNLRIW